MITKTIYSVACGALVGPRSSPARSTTRTSA
jgi:hypothetical protein